MAMAIVLLVVRRDLVAEVPRRKMDVKVLKRVLEGVKGKAGRKKVMGGPGRPAQHVAGE